MKYEDGSIEEFHNRIRIIMGLDKTVIDGELAELNPIAASLWEAGGWCRLRAFIEGSDQVQNEIWIAMLKYERKSGVESG